jgi:hypothetical protein
MYSSTAVHCLWFSDEDHFHLNRFVNEKNTRFWDYEIPHSHEDVTVLKMYSVVYKQQERAY